MFLNEPKKFCVPAKDGRLPNKLDFTLELQRELHLQIGSPNRNSNLLFSSPKQISSCCLFLLRVCPSSFLSLFQPFSLPPLLFFTWGFDSILKDISKLNIFLQYKKCNPDAPVCDVMFFYTWFLAVSQLWVYRIWYLKMIELGLNSVLLLIWTFGVCQVHSFVGLFCIYGLSFFALGFLGFGFSH